MSESSTLIFTYGTLMSGLSNNRFLKKSKFIARGVTKDNFSMYCRGIPFVSKTPKYPIMGEVWKVDLDDLLQIDVLEGHPKWYKREPIEVILENGDKVTAELYFCEPSTGATLRNNGNYREYVKEVRYGPVQTPIT